MSEKKARLAEVEDSPKREKKHKKEKKERKEKKEKKDKKDRKEKKEKRRERKEAEETEKLVEEDHKKDECGAVSGEETPKKYPDPEPQTGNNSILLFYAYCPGGGMNKHQQDKAIAFAYNLLKSLGCTGRLRIGREGYNGTITGPSESVRKFTTELRKYDDATFGKTDFKFVDNQPDSQLLPKLKVFPVTEIVTYGFDPKDAPLSMGGTHLKPKEWHRALEQPNTVVIDVRNFNESLIGKFAPPDNATGTIDTNNLGMPGSSKVLDPGMRKSTDFPQWVEEHQGELEGKKVLMYCTAGVRCERASAFIRKKLNRDEVYQLDGGIHRYLEEFKEDGGHWIGKNYTFDKRFAHGADRAAVVSQCVHCSEPWDRYNAQQKCFRCKMEVLLCRPCQRLKPAVAKASLVCPLCVQKE